MVETLHPDVYAEEQRGQPKLEPVGVGTGGFIGIAKKGPIDRALLVTSFNEYVKRYGSYYQGSFLPFAVRGFFEEKGRRCYVIRVVGSGSAPAEKMAVALGLGPSYGSVLSGNAEPFNLEPGQTLNVKINGGGAQNHTFNAVEARMVGAGPPVLPPAPGTFLDIQFGTGDVRRVTFTGAELTPDILATAINTAVIGGKCEVIGGLSIDLVSDQRGSGALVTVLAESVPGLAISLGLALGSTPGSGDVADIDAVTAAEVVSKLTALTGGSASVENGKVRITTGTIGAAGSVQVDAGSTATAIGFDTLAHPGSDSVPQNTFKVLAQDPGAWGNDVQFDTEVWFATLASPLANGATTAVLSDISQANKGDIIRFYDPVGLVGGVAIILSINVGTKTVTFSQPITVGATLPAGSWAHSPSQHRLITESDAVLNNGDDKLKLKSAQNLVVGSHLVITDGTTEVDVILTGVNGREVKFAAVTLGASIPANSLVVSQEFRLKILEEGEVVNTFDFLSMEPTNSRDYIENRLAGDGNESFRIELADQSYSPTPLYLRIPLPQLEYLAGGLDGGTPGDNDYIGSPSTPKSSKYLFDEIEDLNYFSTPGITSVPVTKSGHAYADWRNDLDYISVAPLSDDEPQEAREYRQLELNEDGSHLSLYYPWIIEADPEVSGGRLKLPAEGRIQGQWSAVAASRGPHVSPANIPLKNVLGLTHYVTDGEQDILNPIGVNCIRMYRGQGVRIWGVRTQASLKDGLHYVPVRRLLNFVKRTLRTGMRWAVFEPNDPRLWGMIERTVKDFLTGIWREGMLFPSTDIERAFFVKCDAETNPYDQIAIGRVWCEVGVNPPLPAEFVIFRIGLWDGGSSIEEEIQRRG